MLCFLFLSTCLTYGNNLAISGISVNQTTQMVTFTISWDNAWNISSTGSPNNWDAVWIFVKFRDCNQPNQPFTHGTLSSTTANHTFGGNLEPMTTVNGSTVFESAVQGVTLDYTDGIMLRRNSQGIGTVSSTVTLNITNLPGTSINLTTNIYAIEMVYVPQGNFYLGDGNGVSTALCSFANSTTAYASPIIITTSYETGAQTFYCNNNPPSSPNVTIANVPAAFPKGQYGFYMMKYELTEGQYAEFLNSLGSTQTAARVLGSFGANRNQLTNVAPYSTTRPDRPQNFLAWQDISAYFDWACLRPSTELEFEKACRGANVIATTGEYAWGTTAPTWATTFSGAGTENGTETTSSGNAVGNNVTWTNGDGGQGPARAGIFATSSSTRVSAGASYYGILDLSGNLREIMVGMYANAGSGAANTFNRSWGDGYLDANGNQNVATWPVFNAVVVGGGTNNYLCTRGGGWNNAAAQLQVSDRWYWYNCDATTRGSLYGGRGVR